MTLKEQLQQNRRDYLDNLPENKALRQILEAKGAETNPVEVECTSIHEEDEIKDTTMEWIRNQGLKAEWDDLCGSSAYYIITY